ncbi:hypothetical protein VCSRO9_3530 [Vibrio cholerae]|nr:hypothetical protein VCSRO9_3530 [Vibrio cholerae]
MRCQPLRRALYPYKELVLKSYVVSEKVLKKVMLTLYHRVIEQENGGVLDLNSHTFHAFDRDMEVQVPEVVDRQRSIPKVNYAAYVMRMDELGYIKRDGMSFVFTDSGFLAASKLAYPVRLWFKTHWLGLSGLVIGIAALVFAIKQLP